MPMIRKHAVMLRTGSCPLFERFILYNNFVRNGGKPLKELHVAPLIWNFMKKTQRNPLHEMQHMFEIGAFFVKKVALIPTVDRKGNAIKEGFDRPS